MYKPASCYADTALVGRGQEERFFTQGSQRTEGSEKQYPALRSTEFRGLRPSLRDLRVKFSDLVLLLRSVLSVISV